MKALLLGPVAAMIAILLIQDTTPGVRIDPTLLAAAIVTVIAAMGGMIVQIINSMSASRDRREAAAERRLLLEKSNETVVKSDHLIEKTAEIHAMTNSTNSNLQRALELMTEKKTGLEAKIVQMEKEKTEIAATRALTDLQAAQALHSAVPIPEIMSVPAAKHLEKIEVNTEAIKENTARTDQTVSRTEETLADRKDKS